MALIIHVLTKLICRNTGEPERVVSVMVISCKRAYVSTRASHACVNQVGVVFERS